MIGRARLASVLARNHYLTAEALANAGFVVAAPQHRADHLVGGRRTAQALDHRYRELATALNAIVTDPAFSDHVNSERVHGLGYSLGGATILLASGAGFDSERAEEHCREHEKSDVGFCESPGWMCIASFKLSEATCPCERRLIRFVTHRL